MRYAGRTLAAALMSAAASIAVALFSAYRLADAPIRGRLAGPDPVGSLASLVAVAIALVVFFRLGRSMAPEAVTTRAPIVAGALGGALAGLAASGAQSFALSDYLTAVLAGYAVPPEFLAIALGTYVVLAACVATVIAAAVTYVGWSRARRQPDPLS